MAHEITLTLVDPKGPWAERRGGSRYALVAATGGFSASGQVKVRIELRLPNDEIVRYGSIELDEPGSEFILIPHGVQIRVALTANQEPDPPIVVYVFGA